jgi:hypothetical protein
LQACRNRASQSRVRKAKPHISCETARPVVAISKTWREVHAEISMKRSTPSRIANTMSRSVSIHGWNIRWAGGVHRHNNAKRSVGSGLQLRCENELPGRAECGPARYMRSVAALRQLGPLQASDEHSTQSARVRRAMLKRGRCIHGNNQSGMVARESIRSSDKSRRTVRWTRPRASKYSPHGKRIRSGRSYQLGVMHLMGRQLGCALVTQLSGRLNRTTRVGKCRKTRNITPTAPDEPHLVCM